MVPSSPRARHRLGRSNRRGGYGHLDDEDPTQSANDSNGLVKSRVRFYETPVQQPLPSSPPPQIPLPPPPQKKKHTQRKGHSVLSNDEARALVQHARTSAAARTVEVKPTDGDADAEERQGTEDTGNNCREGVVDDQYDFPKDVQDSPYFQDDALKQQKAQLRPATPEVKTAELQRNRRRRMAQIPLKRSLSDIASKQQYRSTMLMASAATRSETPNGNKAGDQAFLKQQQQHASPTEIASQVPVPSSNHLHHLDVPVAFSLGSLGAVHLKQGRLQEAKQALGDALSLKRKLSPGSMVADLLNNLGNCSNLMGRIEESLDFYRQALDNLKQNDGPKSEQCNALFNIGRAEVQIQNWDAAVSALSEAWLSSREVFGDYHLYVAQCLDLLGFVQFSTGEFKAAMVSFKGALQVYRKLFGEDHEEVANSMCNVGLVREIKGDFENAWNAYSKGAGIYERLGLPPSDPGVEGAKRSVQRMEVVLKQKASGSKSGGGSGNKKGTGSSKFVMEANDAIKRKLIRKQSQSGVA